MQIAKAFPNHQAFVVPFVKVNRFEVKYFSFMKPIFTGNADHRKTSFVNWRTDRNALENMLAMALDYIDASLELDYHCLEDNDDKKADILIFLCSWLLTMRSNFT